MPVKQHCIIGPVTAGIALIIGLQTMAEIPSPQERLLNSGRNPSNCTWRADNIYLPPPATNSADQIACFRRDLFLTSKPRRAGATLLVKVPWQNPFRYVFCVNGEEAERADVYQVKGSCYRNLDLTPFLRKGHNVLTLAAEFPVTGMTLEGIALGEDGAVQRLLTDNQWRGGWNLAAGWDAAAMNPTNLPELRSGGVRRWGVEREGNPPYYGVIEVTPVCDDSGRTVQMSQPIFDQEKPVELDITLMNAAKIGDPSLTYEIMNEATRKTITAGTVALKPSGQLDLSGRLTVGPLKAGTYRFRLVFVGDGIVEVDRRDYEVACVGRLPMREVTGSSFEDGMELKKIWSVDCSADPEPGMFYAQHDFWGKHTNEPAGAVTNSPLGKYRQTAPVQTSWFGYRYKVRRLFTPHLAVVEWPYDSARSFQVQILEQTTTIPLIYAVAKFGYAFQRGEASVTCPLDAPPSGKMEKAHIIFWPNEEDETIQIYNNGSRGVPAAAARISVYEIVNDVPAVKLVEPVPPDAAKTEGDVRMIGWHSERGPTTMATTFYSGPEGAFFAHFTAGLDHPEFYRNWYTTTENMIKLMRFSGQNLYVMGHFMYNSVLYPSRYYNALANQNSYPGGDAARDYCALVLRMFERNGLHLISSIEYGGSRNLLQAHTNTIEQVRAGAPTISTVSKDGRFCPTHANPRTFNYFQPEVQEELLRLVGELADLYGDYPAWRGVGFLLSRNFGPIAPVIDDPKYDPLDWGYEDYSIAQFQKDTGLRIPNDSVKDPERFGKRYKWLMDNAKDRWIAWRCAQFTRLYCRLRDRLVKVRPDLKLYLLNAEPMRYTKGIASLNGRFNDEAFMKQTVKRFGFDAEALKKEPGIVVSYKNLSPWTAQASTYNYPEGPLEYVELAHNEPWQNLFANDGKGGAYVWSGFFELGSRIPKGDWLFEFTGPKGTYPWPVGERMLDTFIQTLVRGNPSYLAHTWMDCDMATGRLAEHRRFARAYRNLPNGQYARLMGEGRDVNLWLETCRTPKGVYAYAANADDWETEVTLRFAPGAQVRDLLQDRPVTLDKGVWRFRLGPFDVQTFWVEKPAEGEPVVAAEARPLTPPESFITGAVARAEETLTMLKARPAEIIVAEQKKAQGQLEEALQRVAAARAAGDWSRAKAVVGSWSFTRAINLAGKVFHEIPWVIAGPFDNAERKGWEQAYGPESDYLESKPWASHYETLAGSRPWIAARSDANGFVDLRETLTNRNDAVAYAVTEVYSPTNRNVRLCLGSDDGFKIWINRTLYGTSKAKRRASPGQNVPGAILKEGWNTVLFKVDNVDGGWAFYFNITDDKRNDLSDLHFRAPAVVLGAREAP